jgi:predicted transport protein
MVMEQNLKEKTGKDLDEWKAVLAGKGFEKHGEFMAFLKNDCGVSHGYANLIAHKFRESDAGSQAPDDLIDAQFRGKESLRPIYERLKDAILALDREVEIVPKKTSVSFRRKRQFALVKPATKTRIDLGLKFDDRPVGGRLEASGPFGTMCTHRVQLTDIDQVDDELLAWIHEACEEAA